MSARWAIVEINGRQMHAGLVTDEVVLGVQMCVVQQPGHERTFTDYEWATDANGDGYRRSRLVTERHPETRFEIGAGSIYRRTFVSEATARGALPRCSYGEQEIEVVYGEWKEPTPRPSLPGPIDDAEEVGSDWPQPEDCGRELMADDTDGEE